MEVLGAELSRICSAETAAWTLVTRIHLLPKPRTARGVYASTLMTVIPLTLAIFALVRTKWDGKQAATEEEDGSTTRACQSQRSL